MQIVRINGLRRLQLVSSATFSIGHGGNDAQKVMGIITAALIAQWHQSKILKHMPIWVPFACYTAIALGTMSGGWKIVKTMGTRITKVTPFEGVAAETAGAITLFVTETFENSCKHYTYYYGCHYRSRRHQTFISRALGCYSKSFLGMDIDDPCEWIACSWCLFDR